MLGYGTLLFSTFEGHHREVSPYSRAAQVLAEKSFGAAKYVQGAWMV